MSKCLVQDLKVVKRLLKNKNKRIKKITIEKQKNRKIEKQKIKPNELIKKRLMI